MAISPTSEELLKTYTDKLLSDFESRSAIVFYDLSTGLQNRITKEMRILTKYIWQIMNRVSVLETGRDGSQRHGETALLAQAGTHQGPDAFLLPQQSGKGQGAQRFAHRHSRGKNRTEAVRGLRKVPC